MTEEHIRRVLTRYVGELRGLGTRAFRHDTAALQPTVTMTQPVTYHGPNLGRLAEHAMWMALHVLSEFLPEGGPAQLDKANRWLGWIQCALMIIGLVSIEEARDHNRTPAPKPATESAPEPGQAPREQRHRDDPTRGDEG